MQVVQRQGFPDIRIEDDNVGIAAHRYHPLLRVHAQYLGRIRGSNCGEPLQGDAAGGDQLGVGHRHPGLDTVVASADGADGVARQLDVLVGGPFVCGGGAHGAIHQALLQRIPVLGVLDGRVGVDCQTVRFLIVLATEFQVVVQRFAINGQLGGPGFGDGGNALFGGGMDEIYAGLGSLGQPYHLAERDILGDVVVGQVEVGAVGTAFPLQLLFHVGYDVVLFRVDRHDPAALRHLLEYLPEVPGRAAGMERREYLEARDPGLYGLGDLADGAGRHRSGENVVEGVVGIGVSREDISPGLDLGHYGVGRRNGPRCQRQAAGEIDVGGHSPEGRRAAGGFRRLSVYLGTAAGPVIGDGNINVGVGLDAPGKDYLASGVDGLPCIQYVQGSRRRHRRDLLTKYSDVGLNCPFRRDYRSAFNDRVQHNCLQVEMRLVGMRLAGMRFVRMRLRG